MGLDEYRAKRDFTTSPEPAGSAEPGKRKSSARFFCVQKHLATQLHYDFRLEHHGVLLSWAVPKGPSLDPKTKRLAMQVEDHPLEYGDFEGVIPDGYGAGVVMLWDRGTWEPEVDDVDAALRKGDLKLRLDGYKLKGSWALIRTRGYGGKGGAAATEGRSWLLIKHADEWSSGDLDIATFAPLSVKSEGDFGDILAADAPDVWISNAGGGTAASLAKIVEKVERYQQEQGPPMDAARPARQVATRVPGPPRAGAKTKATPTPPGHAARTSPKRKAPARRAGGASGAAKGRSSAPSKRSARARGTSPRAKAR